MSTGTIDIHGARLSRRGFLGAGGALIVALGTAPRWHTQRAAASLDATRPHPGSRSTPMAPS